MNNIPVEYFNIRYIPNNAILYQALKRLNQKIEVTLDYFNIKESQPLELKICGGFALMLHGIRNDPNNKTDIDYIGEELPEDIKLFVKDIAKEFDLPENWLNNDVLLSGSNLEDFEKATGELHFEDSIQFSQIKVSIPSKEDLLRMKIIAIDTSLMALEFGGEFTRYKDFEDIRLLMDNLKLNSLEIEGLYGEYVEDLLTFDLIDCYYENPNITEFQNKSYKELETYVMDQLYEQIIE